MESDLGWSDTIAAIRDQQEKEVNNNFKSQDHALKAGMFMGWLRQRWEYATPVLDDAGDYTPRIIVRDNQFGQVTIEVLPPEGEQ